MNKDASKLGPLVQLQAYADYEIKHNGGSKGKHITQWAAEEIERLNADLAKKDLIVKELFEVIESYQRQIGRNIEMSKNV